MRNGQDFHSVFRLPEDNEQGEPAEKVAPRTAEIRWPLVRRLVDSLDGLVKFGQERLSCFRAPGTVPLSCGSGFCDRRGVNPRRPARHYLPRILRRASGHGTGATAPESNSSMRLAISAAHAASTSSSVLSSRLSSSEAASAALASGESFSASSKSFAGSGFMGRSYSVARCCCNLTSAGAPCWASFWRVFD